MSDAESHHLYVHVPFCRLVCAYCDFVTVGGRSEAIPRYVAALVAELGMRPAPGELRTLYLGGGTPSLLSPEQVATIVSAARRRWRTVRLEELTLEANPSGRERPDWPRLRAAGITRVSLGVQSLRDADLVALARGHSAAEALDAYRAVRDAGFDNVSLDLIYGIPGQTLADWRAGLERTVALEPEHLSCYALQLVLDPDEWAARPRSGALRWRGRLAVRQDEGLAAEQYAVAESVLAEAGYRHYELSSWARRGRESRHNRAYWERRPYTGIGAGAHSYDGGAERSWNERDLDAYLARVEAGERPQAGADRLDGMARAWEAIALGLRQVDGMSRTAFAEEFGDDPIERFRDAVDTTRKAGLLDVDGDVVRLTPRGRLFGSDVLVAFLPGPASGVAR